MFLGGQLISLVGTWMQQVAQSWLIYRLTGSSLLLGTLSFAGQVPVFLIAPLGGIVADRYNRQRIVIATQTASMLLALILAWLTLTNRVEVWHVVVLSALLGVVNAFDIPAGQAFLIHMVGKPDLMNAIALNSSMFNSARMIGPAVAGVMVALMGEGWCFFTNGISYLAVIAGLLMMRITLVPREVQTTSPLENILEGFRFARNSPPIRLLLLMLALCSLVATPYTVLMPIFAGDILHGGPRGLGALMGATGIGALLAAMILAARTELRGLGRWIVWASGGFGVSLVLFAFFPFLLAFHGTADPNGFRLNVTDGGHQYVVAEYDARSHARSRDGNLLHDVYGDGMVWCPPGRCRGPSFRGPSHGGDRRAHVCSGCYLLQAPVARLSGRKPGGSFWLNKKVVNLELHSFPITHDAGGMRLYHGHCVFSEWQFWQARWNKASVGPSIWAPWNKGLP